jgi:riboflavin synthase
MFTGIVEATGEIKKIIRSGENTLFWIESVLSDQLRVDQSLSHNGACLTVEAILEGSHQVTAVPETLKKTTLGQWKLGEKLNLERSLPLGGRIDGHLVQGHVDTTAVCLEKKKKKGVSELSFEFPGKFSDLLIEKGSICLDGISLTIFDLRKKRFSVAIIPFTLDHTNIKYIVPGKRVNLEFDLIGKYIARKIQLQGS